MFNICNNQIIVDSDEYKDIPYYEFDLNKKYNKKNKLALKIDFKNDFEYSLKCLKKIRRLQFLDFGTVHKGLNIRYIIYNYSPSVVTALQAIHIPYIKPLYTFLYDALFEELDLIWNQKNPCDFCDNKCIAARNQRAAHSEDGCCYSFNYSKKLVGPLIENVEKCKHLSESKCCNTQNLSCKFFTCDYLKKEKGFSLNLDDFLLIKLFFNKKQKLIISKNFFKSREEILNKLFETNHDPFLIYYINSRYYID